jgi:ABC-type branched-subunit amino acid transport system substrate-binding protein
MSKFFNSILLITTVLIYMGSAAFAGTSRKIAIVLNLQGDKPFARVESKYLKQGYDYGIEKYAYLLAEHNLEIEYVDDHGSIDGAIAVGKVLSERKDVALVISGYSSKIAVPLSKSLRNKIFIYTFASSVGPRINENLHVRLIGDNDTQGADMYQFGKKRFKPKRACLIAESNDGFSLAVKRGVLTETQKDLSAPVISAYSFLGDVPSDIVQTLDQCLRTKPDVIFHSGRSSSARVFLSAYYERNLQIPIVASDGWGDFQLILEGDNKKRLQERNSPIYLAYYWDSRPENPLQAEFIQAMYKKYQFICTLMPLAHDAIVTAISILANESRLKGKSIEKVMSDVRPVAPPLLLEQNKKFKIPLHPKMYRLHPDGFY